VKPITALHKRNLPQLLWMAIPFGILILWQGIRAGVYDAGGYYLKVLPWLILTVALILGVTAFVRPTKWQDAALLYIPLILLTFGTATQAIWTKSYVKIVESSPTLHEQIPDPRARQDTAIVFAAALMAVLLSCAVAFANEHGMRIGKRQLKLQHSNLIVVLVLLFSLALAFTPVVFDQPLVFEVNKITFVIGMAILLNSPIFDSEKTLKLRLGLNKLLCKIPILKILAKEEEEAASEPLRLTACFAFFAWYAAPLLLKAIGGGSTEFGTIVILFLAFFVMILTYLQSPAKIALVSLIMVGILVVLFAILCAIFLHDTEDTTLSLPQKALKKITDRFDFWIHFKEQGADNQQYLGMRSVLMGGLTGGDHRYFSYVPAGDNDMICAVLIQCFGMIPALILLVLDAILIYLGFKTAKAETDPLQRGMAFGFSSLIGVQSFLMWGGNLVMLPLSGNVQPFLSSGGGSLFASFFMVMILHLLNHKKFLQTRAA